MKIDTFQIEEWMNFYCPSAKYDLTSTCIKPLSLREMLILCNIENASEITKKTLDYGNIYGSDRLKSSICSLYSNAKHENITVTHGAIGANQLVFEALINPGDEVVVIAPIYQQHYSVPKSLGANVKFVFLKEKSGWMPDLKEIDSVVSGKTKLICINNPNNPTGSVMPDKMTEEFVSIAEKNNSWVLSDEVYRGLNLSDAMYSVSIADIYDKGISVGSMSKTYSLPGLRVGWVYACKQLISEVNKYREYNTISVSILDDYFASLALENRHKIEIRNRNIMQQGIEILTDWLNTEIYIDAVLPKAGTTALLRYKRDISSKLFCKELLKRTGVAILPGKVMDMEGTLRLGYCADAKTLQTGLTKISEFLRSDIFD